MSTTDLKISLEKKFPELSSSQLDFLEKYVVDIYNRFPDADNAKDTEDREIAVQAAVDWITKTRTVQSFGEEVKSSWREYWRKMIAAQQAAIMEVKNGADQSWVAEKSSVSSSDIDALLGRRSGSKWHLVEPVKTAEE